MTVDTQQVERTLLALLRTPSYSREERAAADRVRSRLAELGLEVEEDDAGERIGGDSGNLIARVPGTVDAPALLFNAHIDTVDRTEGMEPVVEDGIVRSGGATILGGDDKAGVTAILEGVAAVLAAGVPRPPLELVFTVAEEIGLYGAGAFDLGRLQAKLGFVFDGGTPIGQMTVSAPYQEVQTIVFRGKAAHAGVCPEQGVNAIACAATAISRLRQGRLDEETTSNIGTIAGGRATNIVSDECRLAAEVRSRNEQKLSLRVAELRECCAQAADEFGCELSFDSERIFEGFVIDPDEPVAKLAAAGIEAVGLKPTFVDGGGGSDANIFNHGGLRCILMNCGQRDPHTRDESVALAEVAQAAEVCAAIIARAGEAP